MSQHPAVCFWIIFLILSLLIWYFDLRYSMLRDTSIANKKPFSFSRVQLSWWSVIVLSSFITILLTKCAIPTFDSSTLILLGISAGTTAVATVIDISDQSNTALKNLSQNQESQGILLDILSDKNGVSIHRFQTIVFNIVFGIWFIGNLSHNLNLHLVTYNWITCLSDAIKGSDCDYINTIIPNISDNNLILLGLSSGTYAALKATENKQLTPPATEGKSNDNINRVDNNSNDSVPPTVPDEANFSNNPAQG